MSGCKETIPSSTIHIKEKSVKYSPLRDQIGRGAWPCNDDDDDDDESYYYWNDCLIHEYTMRSKRIGG